MDNQFKNSFVFVLGREQEIALEELKAVLSRFDFSCLLIESEPAFDFHSGPELVEREGSSLRVEGPAGRVLKPDIYKITANQVFANIDNFTVNDAVKVMDALAGTIKIYKLEGRVDKDIASQIASIFRAHKTDSEGKINFAISYFGRGFSRQNINSIALTAKKQLKGDFSLRYVESRDSSELSSILSLKNNLATKGIEFGLFDDSIGVMIALNNPEEWSKRDYDKPAADKYSGMLPPKLARMMVNLALGELICHPRSSRGSTIVDSRLRGNDRCVVVDPFCGSGNILMEGMMLGCDVMGSDVSVKAVADSKKNCQWLAEEYQVSGIEYQAFEEDATSVDYIKKITSNPLILNTKYLLLVTEPFLGEPKKFKSTYNAVVGEYLKIKELYIAFLKNLSKLQTPNSKLVCCIVFPLVETVDGRRFSLFKESVDEIRELGYTQIRQSMTYGRDYQVVKREIVLLKYEQKETSYKKQ